MEAQIDAFEVDWKSQGLDDEVGMNDQWIGDEILFHC